MVLPSGFPLDRKTRCLNLTPAVKISKHSRVKMKRKRRKTEESLSLRDRKLFKKLPRVNRRSLQLAARTSRRVEQREKRTEVLRER